MFIITPKTGILSLHHWSKEQGQVSPCKIINDVFVQLWHAYFIYYHYCSKSSNLILAAKTHPSALVGSDSNERRLWKAETLTHTIRLACNLHARQVLVHGVEDNLQTTNSKQHRRQLFSPNIIFLKILAILNFSQFESLGARLNCPHFCFNFISTTCTLTNKRRVIYTSGWLK